MNDKLKALIDNNPFVQTLAQLHGGLTISELVHAQLAVVEAVRLTGGKGSIKLEIDFQLSGEGQVMLEGRVVPKIPSKAKQKTVFFTNERNELLRTDPNQSEIQFLAVASTTAK